MARPLISTKTDVNKQGGLRQRQKARRRADIITAGKTLFFRKGFSATSMEEVADAAEVGIATVYNYFGSKGQLLADILKPDFESLKEQGQKILLKSPDDPVTGMLGLIDIYRQFQNRWDDRHVLLPVIGPGLTAEPALDALCEYSEAMVKKQIEDLILIYQNRKLIRLGINVKDAATIIFYIFNQHFIEYVTKIENDFDQMKRRMDRQITFIITAILA